MSVGKIFCYEGYEIITMNMDGPKFLELVSYILMMGRHMEFLKSLRQLKYEVLNKKWSNKMLAIASKNKNKPNEIS